MDSNKNYAWVTGVSSPSVSDYKVIDIKKIDSKTYIFKVKFSLEYALKPIGYTYTSLKVEKFDNKWCITNIKESNYQIYKKSYYKPKVYNMTFYYASKSI